MLIDGCYSEGNFRQSRFLLGVRAHLTRRKGPATNTRPWRANEHAGYFRPCR